MSDGNHKTPRFLIARMSAIGDTILTLPVASALRNKYPNAYIAWVVERKSAAMVLDHPCLDDVFPLERGWFVPDRNVVACVSNYVLASLTSALIAKV